MYSPQAVGFVDPKTKETRTIPLEVMVDGDKTPEYGETLEDLGRYGTGRFCIRKVLPIDAPLSLAWAYIHRFQHAVLFIALTRCVDRCIAPCRFQDLPVLPFNAFGTLAMARAESDANSVR